MFHFVCEPIQKRCPLKPAYTHNQPDQIVHLLLFAVSGTGASPVKTQTHFHHYSNNPQTRLYDRDHVTERCHIFPLRFFLFMKPFGMKE